MRRILVGAVGLVLLMSGCGGEPQTVSVPGPTVTTTVPGPVTTKNVTREVTPQSCLDAIQAARDVAEQTSKFADFSGRYPPLVGRAFEAGLEGDNDEAQAILAEMQEANEGFNEVNNDVEPIVAEFVEAADACASK